MTFNSLTFLIFFTVFYGLYCAVRNVRQLRLILILAGSVVFYGWWDWRFLFLILFTGSVDFFVSLLMDRFPQRSTARKLCLAFSLLCGLGTLCIFKYSAFFAEIIEDVFRLFGMEIALRVMIPDFCLILPVGISFYTFQSLSYTIDVYQGKLRPTGNFIHYFAYLMLFPQLVAGPIVRASDLLYRIAEPPEFNAGMQWSGLKLCVLGFFKKCFLADNAASFVNEAFANVMYVESGPVWWIAMIFFGIQIYCDFSGYSDIASGLIRLMGYRFPRNFDHPCFASSMKEFWGRWHISLSSWFRDYVYIPLGGGRHPVHPVAYGLRNMWISMLLSGLWHGAAMNYIFWGAAHALALTIERLVPYQRIFRRFAWGKWLCLAAVQLQVLIAWVFFRAKTLPDAAHILRCMFLPENFSLRLGAYNGVILIVFLVIECFAVFHIAAYFRRRFGDKPYRRAEPVVLALMALAALFFRGDGNVFIYFQF